MWTLVKFLCDNEKSEVHLSHFKDYVTIKAELIEGKVRQSYLVFYSPEENESPESYLRREGKIVVVDKLLQQKGKERGNVAGYYEAILHNYADTLDELRELLQETTGRRPLKPNIGSTDTKDKGKQNKRSTSKANKIVKEQARQTNAKLAELIPSHSPTLDDGNELDDIIGQSIESTKVHESKSKQKIRAHTNKSKGSNRAQKNIDSSGNSDNSDDELIEASQLKEAKQTIAQLRKYNKNLSAELECMRTEREKMEAEVTSLRDSNRELKGDRDDLKVQVKDLLELNKGWQNREFSKSKSSHSSHKKRSHSSSSKSNHSDSAPKKKLILDIDTDSGQVPKEAVNSPLKEDDILNEIDPFDNLGCATMREKAESPSFQDVTSDAHNVGELIGDASTDASKGAPASGPTATPTEPSSSVSKQINVKGKTLPQSKVRKAATSLGGISLEPKDFIVKAPALDDVNEITYEAFMAIAKSVKIGEAGDSQFVKNLADLLWTKEELSQRSSAGKACPNQENATGKKECTPAKKDYIQKLLKLRVGHEILKPSEEAIIKRTGMGNVKKILRAKIQTVRRDLNITAVDP